MPIDFAALIYASLLRSKENERNFWSKLADLGRPMREPDLSPTDSKSPLHPVELA